MRKTITCVETFFGTKLGPIRGVKFLVVSFDALNLVLDSPTHSFDGFRTLIIGD